MTISLCLLTWNELRGCQIDVPNLPVDAFDEVYAVDGGSSDGTVQYLQESGIPVHRQPAKGLNAAYMHAVEKSRCDAVVVFFPKGTVSPSETLRFRPLFENGAELIVASRNIAGGRNEEDDQWLKPRKTCVAALAMLASLVWRREGEKIHDILHGFKGFTVEAFNRMNPGNDGPTIDVELAVRAYRLRIPRAEFPSRETARTYGDTHFKVLPTGLKQLKFLWRELFRPRGTLAPHGERVTPSVAGKR